MEKSINNNNINSSLNTDLSDEKVTEVCNKCKIYIPKILKVNDELMNCLDGLRKNKDKFEEMIYEQILENEFDSDLLKKLCKYRNDTILSYNNIVDNLLYNYKKTLHLDCVAKKSTDKINDEKKTDNIPKKMMDNFNLLGEETTVYHLFNLSYRKFMNQLLADMRLINDKFSKSVDKLDELEKNIIYINSLKAYDIDGYNKNKINQKHNIDKYNIEYNIYIKFVKTYLENKLKEYIIKLNERADDLIEECITTYNIKNITNKNITNKNITNKNITNKNIIKDILSKTIQKATENMINEIKKKLSEYGYHRNNIIPHSNIKKLLKEDIQKANNNSIEGINKIDEHCNLTNNAINNNNIITMDDIKQSIDNNISNTTNNMENKISYIRIKSNINKNDHLINNDKSNNNKITVNNTQQSKDNNILNIANTNTTHVNSTCVGLKGLLQYKNSNNIKNVNNTNNNNTHILANNSNKDNKTTINNDTNNNIKITNSKKQNQTNNSNNTNNISSILNNKNNTIFSNEKSSKFSSKFANRKRFKSVTTLCQ